MLLPIEASRGPSVWRKMMEFPQQPQQQRPAGDGKIIYPMGVKEITDKISNDEVVKRLKVSAKCDQRFDYTAGMIVYKH